MSKPYAPSVSKLLTYGDCRKFKGWPTYKNLGITRDHIPERIRMATDQELQWADSESPTCILGGHGTAQGRSGH